MPCLVQLNGRGRQLTASQPEVKFDSYAAIYFD